MAPSVAGLAGLIGLILLMSGCAQSPTQRLQGRWVGESLEKFPTDQIKRAEDWAAGTSFSFDGRRVTVAIATEPPRRGTFEIAKVDTTRIHLRFLRPHGAKDDVHFEFIGKERLRWSLGDGRSIVLRKAQN